MTEAEALELTIMCVDNAMTAFSIFISITFAFMTVSFLAGSKLSSFQALAASGLYIFTAGVAILCTYLHIRTWGELRSGVPGGIAAMDNLPLWNESLWAYYPTTACIVGVIVSCYFMWDVRHPKIKK